MILSDASRCVKAIVQRCVCSTLVLLGLTHPSAPLRMAAGADAEAWMAEAQQHV